MPWVPADVTDSPAEWLVAASVAFTGTATISGTGTLTSTGAAHRTGSGTIGGTGTLTSTGVKVGTALLTGSGALTSTGVAARTGTGTLTGVGALLPAAGAFTRTGTATLTGVGSLASLGGLPLASGVYGTLAGLVTDTAIIGLRYWVLTITQPPEFIVLNTTGPTLGWTIAAWDSPSGTADVQVEVSTSPTFASTVWSVTLLGEPTDGTEITTAVTGLVDGTVYFWRVRAGDGISWGLWESSSFGVWLSTSVPYDYSHANVGFPLITSSDVWAYNEENIGVELIPSPDAWDYSMMNIGFLLVVGPDADFGHWGDVTTATPVPHIWFLLPTYGRPGEGISIFGFGFGDTVGDHNLTVEYQDDTDVWNAVSISSVTAYPPSPDAYDNDRRIDHVSGRADPQHQVIWIVIPDGAIPPGGPVRVRTDDV